MVTKVSIRLGVEGGADVRRELQDAGRAGQAAFGDIEQAANKAAGAADNLADKAREAGQAGQSGPASRPPAPPSVPPKPAPAPDAPSSAALREAERVRYRLDTEARNSIQLARDSAAIDRAERAGIHSEAESKRLRDLAERKYGGSSNDNDPSRRGLDPGLRQGLTYQGFDVFTTLSGGMSPGLVAAQQGPQIFQTLADGAGVKENLAALGRSALGLVTPMTVGATAVAALGTAFVVASSQAGTERDALEKSVQGIGRATGATVGQLELLSRASAEASKTSTSTAREIVAVLASTGDISLPAIDSVSRSASDFAKLTGTDVQTAGATLAAAFSDPAKGADQLAKAIGGLDDKTRQLIRTQDEAGNKAGAQATMAEYLDRTVKENTRSVEGLAAGWEAATTAAGRYWDRFKTRAGQITGSAPETAEEALARLNLQVENTNRTRAFLGQEPLGLGSSIIRDRDAAAIVADTQRREARAKAAEEEANRASLTAGELARSLDPMGQQLRALEATSVKLRAALSDPLARSKLGDDLPKVEEAFARVTRQIADMKRDMEEFGTTAVANLNRAADFALKTVGYSPIGRASAEAQRVYEEALPNAKTDAEREGLRSIRDKEIERAREEALRSSATSPRYSIGVAQAPAQYRQFILDSAARYGQDPDLMAAMIRRESRWNPNAVSPAGAQGIAQFMPGTARQYGLTNPFDPEQSIDRMGQYLQVLNRMFGGNTADMVAAYNRGEGAQARWIKEGRDPARMPKETRGYLAEVFTAGPGTAEIAKEQDARSRALMQEREALRLTTEAGGRDRDSTLARIEAMRLITDAQGRGITVSRELAEQYAREALERRRIVSEARLFEYRESAAFERSQLGRTETEARGAYVARLLGLDPDSDRGRTVMDTEALNSALRTTKQMSSEALTGMLGDLRRGRSLAESLAGVTDRFADRLINLAADQAVSGLFKSIGGGGGGVFGFISSLMGGGSSGGGGAGAYDDTAALAGVPMTFGAKDGRVPAYADGKAPSVSPAGIISGPGGPRDDAILARVSNREAIIRASSVERYGVNFIRSINEGTAPREVALMGGKAGYNSADGRSVLSRFADGTVPMRPSREAFTMPSREAFATTGSGPTINAPVTVNMQGSSGDPATDRAYIEQTAAALRREMRAAAASAIDRSMGTNGALWKAGVRRT